MKQSKEQIQNELLQTQTSLQYNGYTMTEVSFNFFVVNFLSFFIMLSYAFIFLLIWRFFNYSFLSAFKLNNRFQIIPLVVLLLILLLIHELIHGICFACSNTQKWKSVHFGFYSSTFTPYCNCRECLSKKAYIISLLMPTIILGFIPCIIASFIGNNFLFLLGFCMIFGGGGDFLYFYSLLGIDSKNQELLILDHPYKAGFIFFTKK